MKRVHLIGLFALGISALGWTPLSPADEPAAPPQAAQPYRQHIFFFGDSITRAGGYVRQIKDALGKQNPAAPPVVHNFGHNSETVSNLSEAYHPGRRPCMLNWIDTVVAEKPDLAIACFGINDGIYHPLNAERFAAYKSGIETVIRKFNAVGTHVVLLTPPPFASAGPPLPEGLDEAGRQAWLAKANAEADAEAAKDPRKFGYRTAYPYYDQVLAEYSQWILSLADRPGVSVVDIRTPMLARIKETHGRDAIHPNGTGHTIMAETVLKQWPAIQEKMNAFKEKFKGEGESKGKKETDAKADAGEKLPSAARGGTK